MRSPFNPHALRHACATHMHDHGAPLPEIAIQFGHQNLDTTQVYTRVSTGRMLDVYRKAHPHALKKTTFPSNSPFTVRALAYLAGRTRS